MCRGEGGARVIQRDRDGSTAPGSLELLMRSPPPLVFLGSVSLLLAFSLLFLPQTVPPSSLFSLSLSLSPPRVPHSSLPSSFSLSVLAIQ